MSCFEMPTARVVATSSTLLEEKNKKNKSDEEFNEFEFVVSLSAGDKKGVEIERG